MAFMQKYGEFKDIDLYAMLNGIDCVEEEPAKPGSAILENSNIIVTPHVGGGSADISDVMFPMITENIERLAEGKELKYVVNNRYLEQ